MAEEEKQEQQQQDSAAAEKEARSMGWLPEGEYRGKPENWVDAGTFLEKGRTILPIVTKNNERLVAEVGGLKARLLAAEGAMRASNATIKALEESHAKDVEEQVKLARTKLVEELETASREGDHAGVAKLTDKLTELNTANRQAGGQDENERQEQRPALPQVSPEIQAEMHAWFEKNPEFRNPRRAALANAIAVELRTKGDQRVGAAFLDDVAAEVEKELGTGRGGHSKVAGDAGGAGRAGDRGGQANGKTYADLPADAKAACDKMAGRLVGAGRAHKDIKSWRESYTTQYFAE